jgi:hypothetical protein
MRISLRELAHSRAGDKGNTSNISLIAYKPEYYPLLKEKVTASIVEQKFAPVITGSVVRYEVDAIGALNFALHGALGGGVSRSLCLDQYGKSMASAILTIEIDVGEQWLREHLQINN